MLQPKNIVYLNLFTIISKLNEDIDEYNIFRNGDSHNVIDTKIGKVLESISKLFKEFPTKKNNKLILNKLSENLTEYISIFKAQNPNFSKIKEKNIRNEDIILELKNEYLNNLIGTIKSISNSSIKIIYELPIMYENKTGYRRGFDDIINSYNRFKYEIISNPQYSKFIKDSDVFLEKFKNLFLIDKNYNGSNLLKPVIYNNLNNFKLELMRYSKKFEDKNDIFNFIINNIFNKLYEISIDMQN